MEKGVLHYDMDNHGSLFSRGVLGFFPGLSGLQQQDNGEEHFLPRALLPVSYKFSVGKVFGQLDLPACSPKAVKLLLFEY
jgi:hypothetical protein